MLSCWGLWAFNSQGGFHTLSLGRLGRRSFIPTRVPWVSSQLESKKHSDEEERLSSTSGLELSSTGVCHPNDCDYDNSEPCSEHSSCRERQALVNSIMMYHVVCDCFIWLLLRKENHQVNILNLIKLQYYRILSSTMQ